jgi:hypothetical protein
MLLPFPLCGCWNSQHGEREPSPDLAVEVLCEVRRVTFQLPLRAAMSKANWENNEAGAAVEATVIGWRLPR